MRTFRAAERYKRTESRYVPEWYAFGILLCWMGVLGGAFLLMAA